MEFDDGEKSVPQRSMRGYNGTRSRSLLPRPTFRFLRSRLSILKLTEEKIMSIVECLESFPRAWALRQSLGES